MPCCVVLCCEECPAARTIWLPDDDPRTEICRSVFNVLMCKFYKFYICAVVGIIIEQLNNMHGVKTKINNFSTDFRKILKYHIV